MIRRDYILRMIEEFFQYLARLNALKREELWQEASGSLDERFQQMFGVRPDEAARLTETELLAKLIQSGPTQAVHEKALILTTLLKEAGDVATGRGLAAEGQAYYSKGLNLLLTLLARHESGEFPAFVPKVELFLSALEGVSLPLATQAALMGHYERLEQFGRAEDVLFSMLESDPTNRRLLEFGVSFYERIALYTDEKLSAGNLPRSELQVSLAELQSKCSECK